MTVRSLTRCLRKGLSSLHNQAQTCDSLAASCRSLSTAAATALVDKSLGPSTSACMPQLPPRLVEYCSRRRAPRSLGVEALDKQLNREGPDVDANLQAAAARDDVFVQYVARYRQLTPGQVDTVRLLARSNVGMPYLRGQSILAKVLSVDGVRVVVDTGYHGLAEVPRCDVSISHIHVPDGESLPTRNSTLDIRPGDMLRLRVDATYTPYGDMQLSAVQDDVEQRRRLVWDELKRRSENKQPVKGRVLNECPGGYAVGVAGFTAFLPSALAATATVKLVGVPQDFLIINIDSSRRMMTLRDPALDQAMGGRPARGARRAAF